MRNIFCRQGYSKKKQITSHTCQSGITALLHIPLWQVWEVIYFFLLLPCRQNMFRILKIKISSSRRQIMRIILTHSIKTYLKVPTLCCSWNRYSFTNVFESYSLIFPYATWLARYYLKSRCWSFLSSCITSKMNPILNKLSVYYCFNKFGREIVEKRVSRRSKKDEKRVSQRFRTRNDYR